jgi:DNA gyrase subunit A
VGELVGVASVREGDELMLISAGGKMIRTPLDEIRIIGRATQGVRLLRLEEEDTLVSLAKVAESKDEENAEAEAAGEEELPGASEESLLLKEEESSEGEEPPEEESSDA